MSEYIDKATEMLDTVVRNFRYGYCWDEDCLALRTHLEAREAVVEKLVEALRNALPYINDDPNDPYGPITMTVAALALARGEKP